MSTRSVTIDCPICEGEIEVEVDITSWGYKGSYWDPPEGPEVDWTDPTECPCCKNSFDQEQGETVHNLIDKKIDECLPDWEHDAGTYAAEAEAEARFEEERERRMEQGEPRSYGEFP